MANYHLLKKLIRRTFNNRHNRTKIVMYRIRASDGNCATVRWEGLLSDSKGNESKYLGVEWDNPERGKHNGEYKGKQLFKVEKPNSGSFLREPTVKKGLPLSEILSEYPGANGFLSLDNTNRNSGRCCSYTCWIISFYLGLA